jgi:transcriptional regulator with XRE-family HTH domain
MRERLKKLPLTQEEVRILDHLKATLKERGISAKQSADWLGLSQGGFSRKMKGHKQRLEVRDLLELNKRLQIPWNELFEHAEIDPNIIRLYNYFSQLRAAQKENILQLIKGMVEPNDHGPGTVVGARSNIQTITDSKKGFSPRSSKGNTSDNEKPDKDKT